MALREDKDFVYYAGYKVPKDYSVPEKWSVPQEWSVPELYAVGDKTYGIAEEKPSFGQKVMEALLKPAHLAYAGLMAAGGALAAVFLLRRRKRKKESTSDGASSST